MEVVIVPAWRRPDFLKACLLRLLAADDGLPHYRISLDRGHTPDVLPVATWFTKRVGARAKLVRRSHQYRGNSYNVLTSYRDVLRERGVALVHLVEEDVLVGADYFDFHRRAHELAPDAFAVSACRNQQYPVGIEPPAVEGGVYLHRSYQSIGVSFRPHRLEPVVPHLVPGYFGRPVTYCASRFPHSMINPNHAEQDGLLHRLMEADGTATAYGAVPRAYHVGFVGYHRKGEVPTGSVDQRAEAILAMSAEELNRRAHSYPDHTTIPLDAMRTPVDHLITWP